MSKSCVEVPYASPNPLREAKKFAAAQPLRMFRVIFKPKSPCWSSKASTFRCKANSRVATSCCCSASPKA